LQWTVRERAGVSDPARPCGWPEGPRVNLLDTRLGYEGTLTYDVSAFAPGRVSRGTRAVVASTAQGIEAQTLANASLAIENRESRDRRPS